MESAVDHPANTDRNDPFGSAYEQYSTQKKAVIPLPTNQPMRYAARATLEKWPAGWMVTTYTPEGARPC
ncbi:hypothetical protein [Streptomyces sp. NPDC056323]|uniref:hypothetical protein n=1 Tax=Streptomyces sp. NPDC056323 TaxID=3345784 RepID=UPI0035E3B3F5